MTARPGVQIAAWCSPRAEPYPQGVVRARSAAGFALVATGGGGGAAMLFPRDLLDPLVAAAEAQGARAAAAPVRLAGLLTDLDDAVRAFTCAGRYHGSAAQGAAVLVEADRVHAAAVGLCRVYRVAGGELAALTRDESLFEEYVRVGAEPMDWHRGIVLRLLGVAMPAPTPPRPWQVVSVPRVPGAAYLLCTPAVHACLPPEHLARWTAEALDDPDLDAAARSLWERGHAWLAPQTALPAHANVFFYDRTAAVALVRGA